MQYGRTKQSDDTLRCGKRTAHFTTTRLQAVAKRHNPARQTWGQVSDFTLIV